MGVTYLVGTDGPTVESVESMDDLIDVLEVMSDMAEEMDNGDERDEILAIINKALDAAYESDFGEEWLEDGDDEDWDTEDE